MLGSFLGLTDRLPRSIRYRLSELAGAISPILASVLRQNILLVCDFYVLGCMWVNQISQNDLINIISSVGLRYDYIIFSHSFSSS